jgi:arylsulfatase A-like enzyme
MRRVKRPFQFPSPAGVSKAPFQRFFKLSFLAMLLAAGLHFAVTYASAADTARKSLVLITVEGLRPDHLSCYAKGAKKATPGIDALAAQGILFEQVVTPSASTLPALATLMTGKTPFQHHVWEDDYRNTLSENETTLAERLRQEGYRNGAFLGTSLAAGRGFDQGFDIFQDGYTPPPFGTWRLWLRPSTSVTTGAMSWLSQAGEKPFFLWLHFADPAVPERGTPTKPAEDPAGGYERRLAVMDEQIAKLIEALKKRPDYSRMVIVLTGDHGFGLGDHGEARSGIFLYDSTLRVPLIVRAGSGKADSPRRVSQLSGLIDLYPTLEQLLGLSFMPGLSGKSLLKEGSPSVSTYHATALQGREVFGWAGFQAVSQGNYRLILGPSTELYDVGADPAQTRNLSDTNPREVTRLKEALRALAAGASIPAAHFQEGPPLANQVKERFKKIGFVAPSLEAARARVLPDPGKFRDVLPLLEEMRLRQVSVGYLALQPVREALLEAAPESLFTLLGAGFLEVETGVEGGNPTQTLKTAQRLYPLEPEVYHELGHRFLKEKRFPDAILALETSVDLRPTNPSEVVYDLACAYARNGDKTQALARLKESIRLGMRDVQGINTDSDLESIRGEPAFKSLMAAEFPPPPGR